MAYLVQHPVLSVANQRPMGSLQAGLELKSSLPTCGSQQLLFSSRLPPTLQGGKQSI